MSGVLESGSLHNIYYRFYTSRKLTTLTNRV